MFLGFIMLLKKRSTIKSLENRVLTALRTNNNREIIIVRTFTIVRTNRNIIVRTITIVRTNS